MLLASTILPSILTVAHMAAQGRSVLGITGTVTDPSASVIPKAKVTLTSITTGAQRTVITGSEGGFQFLQLKTGAYRISAAAPGFAVCTQQVTYQEVPVLVNFTLTPAAGTTEVVVSASNYDSAEPMQVDITSHQIDRIPTQSLSSPLSSLVTATTPGVAADSNGSFHPLGDHAEASFLVDGQPITDQQSRTFSNQVSLNALQSIQVSEGAPGVEVGEKTSLVVVAETRSGLDNRTPHGAFAFSGGAYATESSSGNIGFGTAKFGSFTAIDALNSDRFLDTPEAEALHARGNSENLIERLDFKATEKTSIQLNTSLSRSWFQTPNTFDQEALGQNQRENVTTFNVAPQIRHILSNHAFSQTNLWIRQDKIRYRPSDNIFSDSPAYLQQTRRLTNAGLRSALTWDRGRHNAMGGAEFKHTFLAERFATGLTDPKYNSPCLDSDGTPSSDTSITDPSQCVAAGLTQNNSFLTGLLSIDLTRGGRLYDFEGHTDVKQLALYGRDFIKFGDFTFELGLRYDKYNGLAANQAVQPRVGLAYSASALHTNLHLNFSRIFITPYNENLIVASSNGPGSPSAAISASDSAVLNTGRRNQFNIGFSTAEDRFSVGCEYFWKFTYGAYDFDVLLNSPLTFPTQFRKSKIDGGLVRLTLNPEHGFNGFLTVSHVRSRLFGPEIGGISFSAPYSNVARPDHDEGLAMNLNLRYQLGRRGPWVSSSYRYDGGLVAVAVPDILKALRLTGDEQQQMGLHCGSVFATVSQPLRSCAGGIGATRIRIPSPGTENDDRNPPRIAVRNVVDAAIGVDSLIRHENQSLGIRADVVNLGNVNALYNFLSTFSGTHFLTPRAVTLGLRYSF